jgi:bifunctional DNA-binding transcriptional regulator/antitoxin component of YhaV-PrlF toxin-antitoxin module
MVFGTGSSKRMRAVIDANGSVLIPQEVRAQLGFDAGIEVELRVVDGRLKVARPRTSVDEGPHGLRFVADDAPTLFDDDVRRLVEGTRR